MNDERTIGTNDRTNKRTNDVLTKTNFGGNNYILAYDCTRALTLVSISLHIKFVVPSVTYSKDKIGAPKFYVQPIPIGY